MWTLRTRTSGTSAPFAALAEGGFGGFGGIVALLHLLRPDLDPRTRTVSEYALGPSGWLMVGAFLALAAGALALAVSLARAPGPSRPWRPVRALLVAFGLGTALSAAFPTDPTTPGVAPTAIGGLHNAAAVVALTTGLVALCLFGWRARRLAPWRALSRPTLAAALLAAAALPVLGPLAGFGAAERVLVAAIVVGHWAVARHLRRLVAPR